jgi:hypothetical protein
MKGTLTLNGWSLLRSHRLRPGLISNSYRHAQTNWTAQEVYRGANNQLAFLSVHDETGKCIGTVKSVKELP